MFDKFYIMIYKTHSGDRYALTFDTKDEFNKYCDEHENDIQELTLIYHTFGKARIIHDCKFYNI